MKCKITKKNYFSPIFLLFFVSLRQKVARILRLGKKKESILLFYSRLFVSLPIKKHIEMKKLTFFALLTTLFLTACQESIDEKATREAKVYTQKNCPAMLAGNTTIDSLAFEPSTRTFHYYYTLSGVADTVIPSMHDSMRETLLHALKNTTSMKDYKDEGFNFAYTYRSQKHPETIIFDVTFTKEDY